MTGSSTCNNYATCCTACTLYMYSLEFSENAVHVELVAVLSQLAAVCGRIIYCLISTQSLKDAGKVDCFML